MSELKVNKVTPRSGTTVTLGDSGDTITIPSGATITNSGTATGFGASAFRNIVINGDMSIAQRGTSVSGITSTGYYTVDRWQLLFTSLGTWTMSQDTDVPTGQGFATSLKLDCTTADATPSAGDRLLLRQKFEGQNLQYLKKGTVNAESLTLSFWVKSTKTGTFIAELEDDNNSRTISKSYTVNVSNTWEKKTITFEGDTTGAFTNDNGQSFLINFFLGVGTDYSSGTLATSWGAKVSANRAVGQVNLADDTANEWYITGIQLEAGTTASDFEFLPFDVNLGRCQRYFEIVYDATTYANTFALAKANSTTAWLSPYMFQVLKRASPTMTFTATPTLFRGTTVVSGVTVSSTAGTKGGRIFGAAVGLTLGQCLHLDLDTGTILTASAEL